MPSSRCSKTQRATSHCTKNEALSAAHKSTSDPEAEPPPPPPPPFILLVLTPPLVTDRDEATPVAAAPADDDDDDDVDDDDDEEEIERDARGDNGSESGIPIVRLSRGEGATPASRSVRHVQSKLEVSSTTDCASAGTAVLSRTPPSSLSDSESEEGLSLSPSLSAFVLRDSDAAAAADDDDDEEEEEEEEDAVASLSLRRPLLLSPEALRGREAKILSRRRSNISSQSTVTC